MKKIIVVSKTHLDLGYTDFARNVREKYINKFIPSSISLAEKVNKNSQKNFVWTTGSWIIKEALKSGTPKQRANLKRALKNGNIVPHAMPFTVHSELLDEDTFDYGLSIVEELDRLRGRKTVAAKLTDIPGHTRSIVKLLASHGIKLLHIGVNGACPVPKVPECFLWESGDSEVVVVYSDDYGGVYKSDIVDEILYLHHTSDNSGASSDKKVIRMIDGLRKKYPDYEVTAGSLDDFADAIWEKRDKLPVIENEIGDTWIHGSASDPFKSAALRELIYLKSKWLSEKSMIKNSKEYIDFTDNLLCLAEHTCGMAMRGYFADYKHYLKKDFQNARKSDCLSLRKPLTGVPSDVLAFINKSLGKLKKHSYGNMEKSWREQREYIYSAISVLSDEHKKEAESAIKTLLPETPETPFAKEYSNQNFTCGNWQLSVNENGGIKELLYKNNPVIKNNEAPIIEYVSFSDDEHKFFMNRYIREGKRGSAESNFGRPRLKEVDGKYPVGRFPYTAKSISVNETNGEKVILADLACDKKLSEEIGAPRTVQIEYTLTKNGLSFDVSWFNKDANRLTEAIYLRLFPADGKLSLVKIGEEVDPESVVSTGGKNIHAVWKTIFKTNGGNFKFVNRHSPILSIGEGKILKFDDKTEDFTRDGISYILQNNVWGTNFPLWYEDNAKFHFEITNEN